TPDSHLDIWDEIAGRSKLLLKYDGTSSWNNCYRQTLLAKGFGRGSNINQQLLENAFRDRFPEEVLDQCGCVVRTGDDTNWLRGIVRTHKKAVHPLQHILMQIFIDGLAASTGLLKPRLSKQVQPDPERLSIQRQRWIRACAKAPTKGVNQIRSK